MKVSDFDLPTASSSAALGPSPEKRTIHPSGTAPRIGRTTLPKISLSVTLSITLSVVGNIYSTIAIMILSIVEWMI